MGLSKRGQDWVNFSAEVLKHIEGYAVPQYKDKGEDQCSTEFTNADFITQMRKYLNRVGRNARPGQDRLDMLKICHYAQMLADRLSDTDSKTSSEASSKLTVSEDVSKYIIPGARCPRCSGDVIDRPSKDGFTCVNGCGDIIFSLNI